MWVDKQFIPDTGAAQSPRYLRLHGETLAQTERLFHLFEMHHRGSRGVMQKTAEAAQGVLRQFANHTSRGPWAWEPKDVDSFLYLKVGEGVGVARQAQYFCYLRMFQNYLLSDVGLCNELYQKFGQRPARYISDQNSVVVKRKNAAASKKIPLSNDEFSRLMDEIDAQIRVAYEAGSKSAYPHMRNKVIIALTYHLGVRAFEVLGFTMHSFTHNNNHPQLREYGLWIVKGKGGGTATVCLMSLEICDLMDWYIQFVRPKFLTAKVENPNWLFYSERGNQLSYERFRSDLHKYAVGAGIKRPITPHVLRHSYCTDATPLIGLVGSQQQLRHKYLSTTAGTYYHPDLEEVGREVSNAIATVQKHEDDK